jgi:hypothetical protein
MYVERDLLTQFGFLTFQLLAVPNRGHFFTLCEGLPTTFFREGIFSNFES